MLQTDNKRRYERMPFMTRLTVLDAITRQDFEGSSIDLSVVGAQCYVERFLAVDTRIRIRFWLRGLDGTAPVEVEGTVRWARIEQDGAIMGVEFDVPLSSSHCAELYEKLFT